MPYEVFMRDQIDHAHSVSWIST